MKKSIYKKIKYNKIIATGLMFSMLLTGCTSGSNSGNASRNTSENASGNENSYTVNSQGTEELSEVDKNKDNDFSTPENYNKKRPGVDYGYVKNDIKYYSTTIGEEKECGIIFPADYSSDKTYPVVYLIHGFGGSHYDWGAEGSFVQNILGNMIADNTTVPSIIVMPDMYTEPLATKETATEEFMRHAYDKLLFDIKNDLMPFIESNYPVKTGRENTAIIGISQGGTESLAIGFELQDRIGFIGTLAPCSGVIPTEFDKGTFWNIPIMQDFVIKDKQNAPYYIQLTVGDQDPWCLEPTKYYDKVLTEKNIDHTYYLLKNFGHDSALWGNGIYNFLKRIFVQPVTIKPDEGNTLTLTGNNNEKENNMKIIIKAGTTEFTATLSNNMTAEAFRKLLPMDITMEDVNGNEKYFLLPTNIRQEDPQNPGQINTGDIMCYGDKGLVLFYESFPTSYSYVRIGKIDNVSGLSEALKASKTNITIFAAE